MLSCPFYKASITKSGDHDVPRLLLVFLLHFIYLFIHLLVCLFSVYEVASHSTCGAQKTVCENQASAPTMWVSEVKLRLSGLRARIFTCSAALSSCVSRHLNKRLSLRLPLYPTNFLPFCSFVLFLTGIFPCMLFPFLLPHVLIPALLICIPRLKMHNTMLS